MRVTRRFWTLAATALALAMLALVFKRPLLLVGAVGVGSVLVAAQYIFIRRLHRLNVGITVDLSVPQQYVREGESIPVTLRVTAAETPLLVTVTPELPASVDGPQADQRRVKPSGSNPEKTTFEISWPVAGTSTFDAPTVAVTDPYGLFTERFQRGPTPQVTVEPRTTRSLHVGQGGERAIATFGEHATGELGEGLDPAELRQYVAGDSAGDIDWKATARLNEPYVREHEVETDRQTVLLMDHRERFGEGPPGETKLDYLREVALALAAQANEYGDPLGLYTVDGAGLSTEFAPSMDTDQYRTIQDTLYDIHTKTDKPTNERTITRGPGDVQQVGAQLAGDGTAFGQTLQPFFRDTGGHVKRIEGDSMFKTVETYLSRLDGTSWILLFSDDRDQTALRETVKLARSDGDHVVVFLAPDVLFEPGGLADLDDAYERYVEFETFRKELAALDRVTAFEVGPGDRLDAVLSASR
ncbi:DUF58 domain-containing protein [Haloarcula montana]|uniref:DUF58 domain-containing protein n=1 Tax=Haloarcula montana TaxID=3111776 RepID=UPI002D792EF2|nr:DUF58 domain-containing protein [Haloarcula sp. GH36]